MLDDKENEKQDKIKDMKILQIKIAKELEEKIDTLRKEVEQKDIKIDGLQKKIDEKDNELFKSMNSDSHNKKEDLFSSTIEISKKESTIDELRKQLETSEMNFCQLDSELMNKNEMIQQLNDQ